MLQYIVKGNEVMKVKNSVEQAICLLIIIAHSNDEKPLKVIISLIV